MPEYILSGCLLCIMMGAAGLTGNAELIFPEAAALVCGAWLRRVQPWNIDRGKMEFLMILGAFAGIALSRWLSGPLWVRAAAGYVLVMLAFHFSDSSMAPMVSAVILPVMLGTKDILYPVTVTVIILAVTGVQYLMVRCGYRRENVYSPQKEREGHPAAMWGARLLLVLPLTAAACFSGHPFLAAPPLLVLYTEYSDAAFPARRKPIAVFIAFVCAGAAGVWTRWMLDRALASYGMTRGVGCGLLFALAGLTVYLLLLVIWNISGLWIPPMGAAAYLPVLLGPGRLTAYLISLTAGAAVWLLIGHITPYLAGRLERRQIINERRG